MPSNTSYNKACQISVLICTFHRPGLLYGLLESLLKQSHAPTFEVIIIDNDRAGSAATVAHNPAFASLDIHYEIERRNGISFARNHAVALARGDWLAMIDDDERPRADWLHQLTSTQQTLNADGVFGPVLPYYSAPAPQWIVNGNFLVRSRHLTSTDVPDSELRTGNVLLRRSLLDDGLRFDPNLALTGGEDVMLFRILRKHGARFLWCDEAIVSEFQPAERYRFSWILKRYFKGGANFAQQEMSLALYGSSRWLNTARLIVRAAVLLAFAAISAAISTPLAASRSLRHVPIYFLSRAAAQIGKLSAPTSYRLRAYGKPPPPLNQGGHRLSDRSAVPAAFVDRRQHPPAPGRVAQEKRRRARHADIRPQSERNKGTGRSQPSERRRNPRWPGDPHPGSADSAED